jgi:hypothetical protein
MVSISGVSCLQKRVAILLLQAVVSLEEMRVTAVGVKMPLMMQGQPNWSNRDTMNTLSTTCPHRLQIARGTIFQGNVQLIRAESECDVQRTTEHRAALKSSLHGVLRLWCSVIL